MAYGGLIKTVRINITDEQGVLLGQIELTPDELLAARANYAGAMSLVDEICSEAGVRSYEPEGT